MQPTQLELDSNVRRISHGTALLGGSPFRLVRLSSSGAERLDAWLAGHDVERSGQSDALLTRLLAGGMVHPVVDAASGRTRLTQAAIVVPVYGDADGLRRLLTAVRRQASETRVVVVDDASPDATVIAEIATDHGAELVRHGVNQGPGAARNTGWRHVVDSTGTTPEFIIFLDADTTPTPDALAVVLAHFEDPTVAAVAPRVTARAGTSRIDSYEQVNSPLDLGADSALVFPGTRVSYIPSAALAVRQSALSDNDGFNEHLRLGEDVDLIWRLIEGGAQVRYEANARVGHRNRSSLEALARQRFGYGSASGPLAQKHPDKMVPLELPLATAGIWAAGLFGGAPGRLAALVGVGATSAALAKKLGNRIDDAPVEVARLTLLGQLHAGRWIAHALTRAWLPLTLVTRRSRRLGLVALTVPALVKWLHKRPTVDPVSFVGLSAVDDAAYCAGVWSGVWRTRSLAPLRPRLRR